MDLRERLLQGAHDLEDFHDQGYGHLEAYVALLREAAAALSSGASEGPQGENPNRMSAMVGDGWMMSLECSPGHGWTDPVKIADAFKAAGQILAPPEPKETR